MSRFHPGDFTRRVGVSHSGQRSLFGSTAWKNMVAKTIRAMKIALNMIRKIRASDMHHLATSRDHPARDILGNRAPAAARYSTELFQLSLDIAPQLDVRNTIFNALDYDFCSGGYGCALQSNRRYDSMGTIMLVEDFARPPI